jgi:hypothetical protein
MVSGSDKLGDVEGVTGDWHLSWMTLMGDSRKA